MHQSEPGPSKLTERNFYLSAIIQGYLKSHFNHLSATCTCTQVSLCTSTVSLSTYLVITSILSLVSLRLIFNNSCAASGSFFCKSSQFFLSSIHVTQFVSAYVVDVLLDSEKKGSSPHVVPATMSSEYLPWGNSYLAFKRPLSSR